MRLVYMGTPAFAVPALMALAESRHEVAAVVCAPDRPKGRGRKPASPPVKLAARKFGLDVWQPESIRSGDFISLVRGAAPDALVVAALGQILPAGLLDVPRLMSVNIHPSLLPKYQGPAPIQWAVLNGDPETGVTIMAMDLGVDTGDILMQQIEPVKPDDTAESLGGRLARLGAKLIIRVLEALEQGNLTPRPQDQSMATPAPRLEKSHGLMNWARPAEELERHVRGMQPWPGAFTFINGRRVRVLEAELWPEPTGQDAGTIIAARGNLLCVAARPGALRIVRLQPAGKKPMEAGAFLRGRPLAVGQRMG